MATILDVSKLAGVNASTVSRVLNGSARISESTRTRVLQAVETLNYRPNIVAKSLKEGTTNCIGIVIPKYIPMMSMVASLLEEIQSAAEAHNKLLFIAYYDHTKDSPYKAIERLNNHQCEGIVYWHNYILGTKNNFDAERFSKIIKSINIPVVTFDISIPENNNLAVLFDHRKTTHKITQYLCQAGYKNIAFISARLTTKIAQWRLDGYISGLKENNVDFNPLLLIESDLDIEDGYHACQELISREINFTALCCFNDKIAIGAAKAIRELIPQKEIKIFGFGNDPILDFITPSISSIKTPMKESINEVIDLLFHNINDKNKKNTALLKTFVGDLVIR
ncbi:LacI family DNA-binding transcriptional regulator [Tolumonas auensis]|uniref:LacI family DNA-binding transcriptional regulator n=1 Tax=Tolumonas auensis TaxID=43948 RepID=UPI002AA76860|nr:LacI family DNA-binding transcriptional regulator [Tolumonas auensis]